MTDVSAPSQDEVLKCTGGCIISTNVPQKGHSEVHVLPFEM